MSSLACSIALKQAFNRAGAVISYLNKIERAKEPCGAMTPLLIAAREGIVLWVTLTLMPVEVVFDCLEDEIERRCRHDSSMH